MVLYLDALSSSVQLNHEIHTLLLDCDFFLVKVSSMKYGHKEGTFVTYRVFLKISSGIQGPIVE